MIPHLTEHEEQCLVIEWVRLAEGLEPRLGLLFAIPNGAKLPYATSSHGARYSPEAVRLKSEGLRPGTCDLMLPVAMNGYHGLFLELKSMTGTVRPEQKEFIERVQEQGYRAVVCRGADAAISALQAYLGMEQQLGLGFPTRGKMVEA